MPPQPESQPAAAPVVGQQPPSLMEQMQMGQAEKDYDRDIAGDLEKIRNTLFGVPPDTPEGKFVKNTYDRLHANKGYTVMQERIMLAIRNRLREIQDRTVAEARARGEIISQTRQRLGDLRQEFVRTVSVMGQSMKTENTDLVERKETGFSSDRNVLDFDEGLILQRFAEQFEKVNFDELSVALIEDQGMVTMLTELQNQSGNRLRDADPLNVDVDRDTQQRVGKLDPPEVNPLYWKNMDEIRDFIAGRPVNFADGGHGKERSKERRQSEGLIWMRLVSNMNLNQKRDLIESFLKDPAAESVAQTKDFIQGSILSGAMTRQEVMEIYGDKSQEKDRDPAQEKDAFKPLDPELRKKLDSNGKDFAEFVTQSVQFRERAKENIKYAVSQVENGMPRNFVGRTFSFANLIMGRLVDFGVITTVVNVALDIGDEIRLGKKGELGKNILRGIKNAATDGYVALGIGEVVLGSNYAFPWVKNWILSPSKEQERQARLNGEYKRLRDETMAHPAVSTFVARNFDKYVLKAKQNERKGKGNDLSWDDDIKISPQEAKDMGYLDSFGASAVELAQANVRRIFKICTKDLQELDLNSSDRVNKFFAQVVDSPNRIPSKLPKSAKA